MENQDQSGATWFTEKSVGNSKATAPNHRKSNVANEFRVKSAGLEVVDLAKERANTSGFFEALRSIYKIDISISLPSPRWIHHSYLAAKREYRSQLVLIHAHHAHHVHHIYIG